MVLSWETRGKREQGRPALWDGINLALKQLLKVEIEIDATAVSSSGPWSIYLEKQTAVLMPWRGKEAVYNYRLTLDNSPFVNIGGSCELEWYYCTWWSSGNSKQVIAGRWANIHLASNSIETSWSCFVLQVRLERIRMKNPKTDIKLQ